MVLICSQVTRVLHPRNIIRPTLSILPTEHHLTHVESPCDNTAASEKEIIFHYFKLLL